MKKIFGVTLGYGREPGFTFSEDDGNGLDGVINKMTAKVKCKGLAPVSGSFSDMPGGRQIMYSTPDKSEHFVYLVSKDIGSVMEAKKRFDLLVSTYESLTTS